jgi:hypothetical protein
MPNQLIVGADLSSKKVAFFALHPTLPVTRAAVAILHTSKYSPKATTEAKHATYRFLDQLGTMCTPNTERLVFIEKPVVGRGGANTAIVQAYINGVVQQCYDEAGFMVHMVNQSTWKAFLGIAGARTAQGNDKPDLVRVMKARFPKDVSVAGDDIDVLDAAAIARYGQDTIRKRNAMARGRGL